MGKGRRDRSIEHRDMPNYGIPEASWSVGLSPGTIRAWAFGRGGTPPLFEPASRDALSYWNIAEIYVLRSLRFDHKMSMRKIRDAIDRLATTIGSNRPLLEFEFMTNGFHVLARELWGDGLLLDANQGLQIVETRLVLASLKRIKRDWRGRPESISPWRESPDEPIVVEISHARCFGRLVVAGTRIPTEILRGRNRAGDSVAHLARDYDLPPDLVEAALNWGPREKKTARPA